MTETCPACPAQWDGRTDDGKRVYVRYRWGWLSVRVGEGDDLYAAVNGEEVFAKECGEEYDGFMTLEELIEHTPDIQWPRPV